MAGNQMQWNFDAPSGTFKSHAMSRKLYMTALENSVVMDHVVPVDGYGKKKGETVTLTRLSAVAEPSSIDLVEGVRIPEDFMAITTTSITVGEIGRALPYTSLDEDLSWFDLGNQVQAALEEQMRLGLDTKFAGIFKTCKLKYIPTGEASATIDTDGTASTAASANMNVWHLGNLYDTMYDTYLIPPLQSGDYVGIFRHLALRGIMNDPNWEEWKKYTDPSAKFNSEVGRMERIRLVDTNHAAAFGKIGTGSVLGEGVVFGRDSVVMATALDPELMAKPGADDFGRNKAVSWYGILNGGVVWDTANAGQTRIVHVASS